jgi:hypothetical protein
MSKNAITAALPHSFTRSNPVRIALHDPTQFARLVVGELPGEGEKLCPRDWALLLILKIVEPRHELGSAIWLSIHDPGVSTRHRNDDVSLLRLVDQRA